MKSFLTVDHLLHIVESMSDGIQIIDQEGYLIYCNKHSAMLDDIDRDEAIGHHITSVYPSLKEQESTLLKVLETQETISNREQTYRNYKGKKVTTVNTTLPLMEGHIVRGAVEISQDITAYKELSERFMDLQSRLHHEPEKEPIFPHRVHYCFDDIITQHVAFQRMKKLAMKASQTDIPILIYGETGTGKELMTQAIHHQSKRRHRPFIAQNCAALPASLLEGILFGTVKGGFTDAVDRMGLFEMADKGTLFLDEINSMPLELQAKLLRVLQDGKIRRVGDTKERQVDVRIIAATNIEPNKAIEEGLMRRDLYYRINTVTLWIPRLSDRQEDIPLLTDFFIGKYNRKLNRNIQGVSPAVKSCLLNHPWNGNVRELEHVIEGAIHFAESQWIMPEDLPPNFSLPCIKNAPGEDELDQGLQAFLEKTERKAIEKVKNETGGNISEMARMLKIPRQTLQYKLKKYHL